MPRSRKTASLARQSAELASAVPQVVAHRVARMALAGAAPSERDRKEFQRMVDEKNAAFGESWNAMAQQALRVQQALAASLVSSFWQVSMGRQASGGTVVAQLQKKAVSGAMSVLGHGMAPVHRRAVANAKRLSKTSLR